MKVSVIYTLRKQGWVKPEGVVPSLIFFLRPQEAL